MASLLIKNGRIWNGNCFFDADLFIANGKVIKIEKNVRDVADYAFDAKDKIVSPGLVDIHQHIKGIASDKGYRNVLTVINGEVVYRR